MHIPLQSKQNFQVYLQQKQFLEEDFHHQKIFELIYDEYNVQLHHPIHNLK